MTFQADYPGAIVVEAANYGYAGIYVDPINRPKGWCLHTPEEPADNEPDTPYYFHNTTRNASTTYFVSWLGFVFQCVPENQGAYANAVEGKPYPAWANSGINLNLQTLSIEIEGYAATIHQTMPRGSAQWKALVGLMAHRCKALGIPPRNTIGHKQVSTFRSDPGLLDIVTLVADVEASMKEDEPMTAAEKAAFAALQAKVDEQGKLITELVQDKQANVKYVQFKGKGAIYGVDGNTLVHIVNWDTFKVQADETDPLNVLVLVPGTPEFNIYKTYSAHYKFIPGEMTG